MEGWFTLHIFNLEAHMNAQKCVSVFLQNVPHLRVLSFPNLFQVYINLGVYLGVYQPWHWCWEGGEECGICPQEGLSETI